MGEIRNTRPSSLVPSKGLLIGIALGVIGAALAGALYMNGKLSRSLWTPSSPGIHAASLKQLKTALAEETQSRRELADRIAEIDANLARLQRMVNEVNKSPITRSDPAADGSPQEDDASSVAQSEVAAGDEAARFDDEVLLSQGVHPSDIERLHDRWAQYELERQTIADSALREGWFFTDRHRSELRRSDLELREDLTDTDYDRYLYALGKPNRVVAGEVLPGSAARAAGLHRGDVILHYGDIRVFNPGEIVKATSQVEAGESAPLIYLRDGQKRTTYIESGPLGVILEHNRGEPFTD
jgi:hypothetical protein